MPNRALLRQLLGDDDPPDYSLLAGRRPAPDPPTFGQRSSATPEQQAALRAAIEGPSLDNVLTDPYTAGRDRQMPSAGNMAKRAAELGIDMSPVGAVKFAGQLGYNLAGALHDRAPGGAAKSVGALPLAFMGSTGRIGNAAAGLSRAEQAVAAAERGAAREQGLEQASNMYRRLNARTSPRMEALRDPPRIVRARMSEARELLNAPLPEAAPKPRGNLIDRSLIKPDEGPTRAPLPQRKDFLTPRAASGHLFGLGRDENLDLVRAQFERGEKMMPSTFYPSHQAVMDALANAGGDPQLFHKAATASAIRSGVRDEIVGGSTLQWALKQGIISEEELARAAATGGKGAFDPLMKRVRVEFRNAFPNAQGVRLMQAHGQAFDKQLRGAASDAYKIPTYGLQKLGDEPGFVLDTHEAKGGSLASPYHRYFAKQGGFSTPEYGRVERNYRPVAEELGVSDRRFQEARWRGGGDITGLKTPGNMDYGQLFEDLVNMNAEHRGLTPKKMLREMAKGNTALYFPRKGRRG